ncbi:MAG: type 1 glutamine amidotransferase [Geodermatophilaceae bacterium]|nr:type 1 glutamine amidotransferase [Geodermatophilaceae bacterium]
MPSVLVIEPDASDPVGPLGDWLTDAGLHLDIRRPHAGDQLPGDLSGYDGLVVLGGAQSANDPDEAMPWMSEVRHLLRAGLAQSAPILAICLGGQLLAQEAGGSVRVGQAGPEIGALLVGKRDAAFEDPIFAWLPITPLVIQWHHDEIDALPPGAVVLANSVTYPHQAFRIGSCAWGVQFHIETTPALLALWADEDTEGLAKAGLDKEHVLAEAAADQHAEIASVWGSFATRFAALVADRAAAA